MSKLNQAEFQDAPLFEEQFKDRYNRKTKIKRAVTLGEDGLVNHVTVHLWEEDDKYTITEYLTKDQLTDYVLSGKEHKEKKYNKYLDAEVYIADLIGQSKKVKKEKKHGNLK